MGLREPRPGPRPAPSVVAHRQLGPFRLPLLRWGPAGRPAGCRPVFPLPLRLIAAECEMEAPSPGGPGLPGSEGTDRAPGGRQGTEMGTPHLQDGELVAEHGIARGSQTSSGQRPQARWTLT